MTPPETSMHEPVEHFISQNVLYILETEGRLLVIENVPARVSQETGEQLFSPKTVRTNPEDGLDGKEAGSGSGNANLRVCCLR